MLSSVLNSKRAIQVNIAIMRAFVRMREILLTNKDLAVKIEALELRYKNHDMKLAEHDKHIGAIFEAIKQLMAPMPVPEKPQYFFRNYLFLIQLHRWLMNACYGVEIASPAFGGVAMTAEGGGGIFGR